MLSKYKEQESDLTDFEKFEKELKSIIFNILFVMLKEDDEGGILGEIILNVGDGLQTLGLSFNISIEFPWRNDNFVFYFESILFMVQIAYWCSYLTWESYLAIFYIFNILILLVIFDIIYIGYSFSIKRFTVMWPLYILRSTCGLFVTVLFMPLMDLLTSMPQCDYDDGVWVQQFFPYIICYQGVHLFHTVFGFIVAGLFVIVCTVVSMTYYESKDDPNDPGCKINNRCEVLNNCVKILGVLVTTFFILEQYRWMVIIVLTVTALYMFVNGYIARPYYKELMNKTADIINGIYLWSCITLILAMFMANTEFNAAVPLFFLGSPVIGICLYTMNFQTGKLLMKPIEQFESGNEWYQKIKYYICLIHHKDNDREAAIELKGFVYDHEESCFKKDCPLKLYKENIMSVIKDKKRKMGKNLGAENNNLLWGYANRLYQQGLTKYPNATMMRIAYALFLNERMGSKTLAINELLRAEKAGPPFDEQFLIYRYRKLIEDVASDVEGDDSNGQGQNVDVVLVIAYDNHVRQCQEYIEKAAYLHMEFWNELQQRKPDLAKLSITGSKINTTIAEVEDHWTRLQKLNPNNPKALRMYGDFLIEILNDKDSGQELISRAKDNVVSRAAGSTNFYEGGNSGNNPADVWLATSSVDESPCVLASGELNKFGEIVQFNMGMCRIFGFTKSELLGKKIDMLMPKIYSKRHDSLVKTSLQKAEEGEQTGENNEEKATEKLILAKHKSGYLIPLMMENKIFFFPSQGSLIGALFKCEKRSYTVCYLLLDSKEEIVGVSSLCVSVLRITNGLIREFKMPINVLAPDFLDPTKIELFRSKEGGVIDFFIPDTERKVEEKSDPTTYSVGKDSKDAKEEDDDAVEEASKTKVSASDKSVKMKCHVTNVQYTNEANASGYIVRLEPINEDKISVELLKITEEPAYADFQIVFDPLNYQYLCAWSKEDAQKEKQAMLMKSKSLGVIWESPSKVNDTSKDEANEDTNVDASRYMRRPTRSELDIKERKNYGEGIKTKRLQDGVFIEIAEINKMKEREMEEQAKLEEDKRKNSEKDLMSTDAVKESLKSRKGLIAVIKDKSDPPSIVQLKITGYIIILCFLAMTSAEFGITLIRFKTINEDMSLIRSSYRRITLFMRITYYINKIMLANSLSDFQAYYPNNFTEFAEASKKEISDSLSEIYTEQNILTLSKMSTSKAQSSLLNDKTVALEFKNSAGGTKKITYYTLTEAVLQLTSSIFTITNLNYPGYLLSNDDIEFVLYNVFKDVNSKMLDSSSYYVTDARDHIKRKKIIILIMFIVSLVLLVLSITILFPTIASVRKIRTQVLSLFLDIPLTDVYGLMKRCERYLASKNEDQNIQMLDSSESQDRVQFLETEEEANSAAQETPRYERNSRRRQFMNNKSMNASFFFRYSFGILVFASLHIANYVLSMKYLNRMLNFLPELEMTAFVQPTDATVLAMTQELIAYGNILSLKGTETFDSLAGEKLSLMQKVHHDIQYLHLINKNEYPDSYKDAFNQIMLGNLCDLEENMKFTFDCINYIAGVTREGLGTIMVQYVEGIRELLAAYERVQTNTTLTAEEKKDIFAVMLNESYNSRQIGEEEVIVHEIMEKTFKQLMDDLMAAFDSVHAKQQTQRIIFYVVVICLLLFVFFLIWVPFINNLSTEIWRTKCMLTIIPKEVIAQMKSVQKFLNDPNIFSAKGDT